MKHLLYLFGIATLGLMLAVTGAEAGSDILSSADVVLSKKAMNGSAVAYLSETEDIIGAAANPYYMITADNPAFEDSGLGSIQNVHNNQLRFGEGGRVAIPGEAGLHADSNSVVEGYNVRGSVSIIAPAGRN